MYTSDDTIVAIATPLGEGGLGVVRLSGPNAISIASRLFETQGPILKDAATHTLHHGWIRRDKEKIDEAVAGLFRTPRSYTGEDVVEFSCHGSPAILHDLVSLCQSEGARLAYPGEFTQRAYSNGKLDLTQAEAVADLIQARSTQARKVAADQLQGSLSHEIRTIRDSLIDLLAHVEANLDFVEEDIPNLSATQLSKELTRVHLKLENLLSTQRKGRLIREGARIPLVGRPNVGKSSLFNALLANNRAIVTEVPGTTRDTLEESVQWGGFPLVLTDTAGLRESNNIVEKHGTTRTKQAQNLADLVLLILDGSSTLTPEDQKIIHELNGKPTVVVLNKRDQGVALSSKTLKTAAPSSMIIQTSAISGLGLEQLKRAVVTAIQKDVPEVEGTPIVTNQRHIEHLDKANTHVEKAMAALQSNKTEESLAIDIRSSLEELGKITGESVTEDVLTKIFSRFCIGK